MARYVDIDNIIPLFEAWINEVKKEYPDAYACAYIFTMKKCIEILEKHEVDAIPVVRCKDCKNCKKSIFRLSEEYMCLYTQKTTTLDDYCSCAERRK